MSTHADHSETAIETGARLSYDEPRLFTLGTVVAATLGSTGSCCDGGTKCSIDNPTRDPYYGYCYTDC